MDTMWKNIRQRWFENRIFISLIIVMMITLLSFLVFNKVPSNIEIAGKWLGYSPEISTRYGYMLIALMILIASMIRMWSGSILTSGTVMAFKIKEERFINAAGVDYLSLKSGNSKWILHNNKLTLANYLEMSLSTYTFKCKCKVLTVRDIAFEKFKILN